MSIASESYRQVELQLDLQDNSLMILVSGGTADLSDDLMQSLVS